MEGLEKLKEKFKEFVKNSFEELGVLVDKFDFDFSEPTYELYREIFKNKKLLRKFVEIDFALNISLDKLGNIPYRTPIHVFSYTGPDNVFSIYARYKLENDSFVEDPEMTGYRTFDGALEGFMMWLKFGFMKRPYLPDSFIKKYKSKGFDHYRSVYNYESLGALCNNLEISFKNLNVLI